jgi:molybdopterin synthase catalytic subunit
MATIHERVRSQMKRWALDEKVRRLAEAGTPAAETLERLTSEQVHGLVTFHGLFRRRSKADAVTALLEEVYHGNDR